MSSGVFVAIGLQHVSSILSNMLQHSNNKRNNRVLCHSQTSNSPNLDTFSSRSQRLITFFKEKFFIRKQYPALINWEETIQREVLEMMRYDIEAESCRDVRQLKSVDATPLISKWINLMRKFSNNARTSIGNRLSLLVDDDVLPALLNEINVANKRIWLESYIFDGSTVAETFVSALIAARKRGVDVVVVVDWLGAFDMKAEWIKALREAGAAVVVFNNRWKLAFRDHRKLAVIDCVGFCGSTNISEEAAGSALGGDSYFFDVHVKVAGPAVADIASVILDTLSLSKSGIFRPPLPPPDSIPYDQGGGSLVQVLESNAAYHRRTIQPTYNDVISQATTSVSAMTGYFAPPWLLRRCIDSVARRGVPVTLLMSGNSDVWGDVFSAKFAVSKFLKMDSTRVWFSQNRHCHGKTLVVDGVWAAVGSFNWDRLAFNCEISSVRHSGRRNLEAVVSCFDARFAKQLQALHTGMIATKQGIKLPEEFTQIPLIETSAKSERWIAGEKLACEFRNRRGVPIMKEMTLNDWRNQSWIARHLMRAAAWCVQTSGTKLLDSFADYDTEAEWANQLRIWNGWRDRAQTFFIFGPAEDNVQTFLYCCVW